MFLVLLQFSWRRGSKDSRGQGFKGLFSKDFISAFNILSISAMSFYSVLNSPFLIKSKSPANNILVLSVKLDSIFLPLGILLLFYISLNRVRMTFAKLLNLCNSLAFHSNPWILDPLYPLVSHLLNWK